MIIEGLAGHVFHDAVAIGPALTMSTVLRSQTGPVSFDGEVDRVYLEQRGPVSILDRRLGRRITITKTGSRSTVVWNPWQNKSDGLGDMGDDGFKQMVCVEAANTIYDAIVLPPQQSAEISVTYESAPL